MRAGTHLARILSGVALLIWSAAVLNAEESPGESPKATFNRLANEFQRGFLWAGHESHFRQVHNSEPLVPKILMLLGSRVTKVELEELWFGRAIGTIVVQVLDDRKPLTPGAQQENTYKFHYRAGRWHVVSGTSDSLEEKKDAFGMGLLPFGKYDGTAHYDKALEAWQKADLERMKQPDATKQAAQAAAARAKAAAAASHRDILLALSENLSGEELVELARGDALLEKPVYRAVFRASAPRIYQPFAALLRDPRSHDKGNMSTYVQPPAFILAGEMLCVTPQKELTQALTALWPPDDKLRRHYLLQSLATSGAPEAVATVEKSLEGGETYEALRAITEGLRRASELTKGPSEVARAVAKKVSGLAGYSEPSVIMVLTDPEKAVRHFTGLSPADPKAHREITSMLSTMAVARLKVPRENLLAFLGPDPLTESDKVRHYGGFVFPLLGLHSHPDDRKLLETWMNKNDSSLSLAAAIGLGRWHGLPDFDQDAFIVDGDEPPTGLPPEILTALVAEQAARYVYLNGIYGLMEGAPLSVIHKGPRALEAVGETERARLLGEAVKLNEAARATRKRPDEAALEKVNDAIRNLPMTVPASVLNYRIRHAVVFKSVKMPN